MKAKTQKILSPVLMLFATVAEAQSDQRIVSGANTIKQVILDVSVPVTIISLMVAGFAFHRSRQEGAEKFGSVMLGCIVISAAGTIVSIVTSAFN